MLNKELHEKHMKNILDSVFTHDIGNFLAFKGGTLAYRIHRLERFSTDIDLDILDIDQEENIIQSMREILVNLGDIKNETIGKTLHRRVFRYDESGMNIKVELNKRIRDNNIY